VRTFRVSSEGIFEITSAVAERPGKTLTQRMIDFANKCLMSRLLRDEDGVLYATLRDFNPINERGRCVPLTTFSVWSTYLVEDETKHLVYGTLRFSRTVRGLRLLSEFFPFKEVS
jgi:hypothetical protein